MQDSIAYAVDRQKRNADKNGRANVHSFVQGDLVLLYTVNLPRHVVTNVGSSKLLHKYIGPFRVCADKATNTRSSCHVGCARILRLAWGVSTRTVSTSPLPTMKIAPTFKNLHQVLDLQTISLVA